MKAHAQSAANVMFREILVRVWSTIIWVSSRFVIGGGGG